MALAIPLSRWLGERYGYKRMFLAAMFFFALGSALCGIAWSLQAMIFFRALQAIGGGMIMPVAMTILYRMVPRERLGTAMGIWSVVLMVAPTIAPPLGGYLVEDVGWRFIFYVNIPVCVVAFALARLLIPPDQGRPGLPFDLPGFLTVGGGLFALSEGQRYGWTSEPIIICFYVAACLLAGFVCLELAASQPLLDLRVFAFGQFTVANLLGTVQVLGFYASVFFVPIFLQTIQGNTALQAGLILLPAAVVSGVVSPFAGRLYDRFGPRLVIVPGLLVVGIFSLMLHQLSVATPEGTLVWWLMGCYAGLGLIMTPMMSSALAFIPPSQIGSANTLFSIVRAAGSSLGLTVLNVMLQSQEATSFSDLAGSYAPGTSRLRTAEAVLGGKSSSPAFLLRLYALLQSQSFVKAVDNVFLFVAGIAFGGILLTLYLRRHPPQAHSAASG